MAEYDDMLALWYSYATQDHANPMCVSFRNERDAIREVKFYQTVASRLNNRDSWHITSQVAESDNPPLNEKKGDVRYYVMVQRG